MARKRVTRGEHKPAPQNADSGAGNVDTLVVGLSADPGDLFIQWDLLEGAIPFRLQVWGSRNGAGFALLYSAAPILGPGTVGVGSGWAAGQTLQWYYEERSLSGELFARSNITTVVL